MNDCAQCKWCDESAKGAVNLPDGSTAESPVCRKPEYLPPETSNTFCLINRLDGGPCGADGVGFEAQQ